MTVSELIEFLRACDQDADVTVYDNAADRPAGDPLEPGRFTVSLLLERVVTEEDLS